MSDTADTSGEQGLPVALPVTLRWSDEEADGDTSVYSPDAENKFSKRSWPSSQALGASALSPALRGEYLLPFPFESSALRFMRLAYNLVNAPQSVVRFGTYMCECCQNAQERSGWCNTGCITNRIDPTKACAECTSKGASGRCDWKSNVDTEVGNRAGLGADVGELIGGLKMALTMSDQQNLPSDVRLTVAKASISSAIAIAQRIRNEYAGEAADFAEGEMVTPRKRRAV